MLPDNVIEVFLTTLKILSFKLFEEMTKSKLKKFK